MALTGRSICDPTVIANGKINAQSHPFILHSNGISSVVKITIIAIHKKHMVKVSLKPCHILGTSIQNEERSTSLPVEPHVLKREVSLREIIM